MKNKENERKEREIREDEGKGGWRENERKKVKRKVGKEMGRKQRKWKENGGEWGLSWKREREQGK